MRLLVNLRIWFLNLKVWIFYWIDCMVDNGEYACDVVPSILAKMPVEGRNKKDHRQGTIETDPEYLAFVESLNEPVAKEVATVNTPTIAPIVEYLRDKAAGKCIFKSEISLNVVAKRVAWDAKRDRATVSNPNGNNNGNRKDKSSKILSKEERKKARLAAY